MQGRRAYWHDYRGTGFYMVTLTTSPRRPLFGRAGAAGIDLSPEGHLVREAWHRIPEHVPQIELSTLCIMPDHLHGILCVVEPLERPLGQAVRGFKSGVTTEVRRLANDASLSVWEPGYHDLVALEPASLHAYHDYILDNPRRLRLKQAHPDLFTRRNALQHQRLPVGYDWAGYGNLFLLDHPEVRVVQVSRSITAEALAALQQEVAAALARGAVLVSPFISQGEKAMVEEVLAQPRGRVIVLKGDGFRPLYKPSGVYFDMCAEGRLLILSPYAWSGRDEPLTRPRCLELNAHCLAVSRQPPGQ